MKFNKVDVNEIKGNTFDMIGKQWMLITGGTKDEFNTMTASWGALGVLWHKPVAVCLIRPQRHTLGFVENNDCFTLSFYDEKYRPQLSICGTKSGKDIDKVKETGFTPCEAECGAMYFEEAELVLVCKKIYIDDMKPENILDKESDVKFYPDKDYHKIFVGEIIEVLKK